MYPLPSTALGPAVSYGSVSRRRLLTWAGVSAAGLSVTGLASLLAGRFLPGAGPASDRLPGSGGARQADGVQAHKVIAGRAWPAGYFHALFSLSTPQEIDQSAAIGVNFTICYGFSSQQSADAGSEMGQAMARNGMRTFLSMLDFLKVHNGAVTLDTAGATALTAQFRDSPLLAGYWIKDDDLGDERAAVMARRTRLHLLPSC